jgi:catechol 2,3-dioxygenase-like lactoylglutathione lyase family enzyme
MEVCCHQGVCEDKENDMSISDEVKMTLRLELFVKNLASSADFYSRVLGFEIGEGQLEGYTPITRGKVQLGLNLLSGLPDGHPVQSRENERLGRGIEIVLEVGDIEGSYQHVLDQDWPLSNTLQRQPWGLTDFRILDPDGYYLRITSR